MTIAKLYAAPTITFRARWLETERALPGCGEPESMPMGSFAEEVATEAMRRRHRQRAEEAEAALPPLEKRPEWRRQAQGEKARRQGLFSKESPSHNEWGSEVVHGDASYMLATPEYQALTGTRRPSYQKARSDGLYILRRASGEKHPGPIFYQNLTGRVEKVFVKATGLRVINGKMEYRNRSASGVETIRPIDWHNQKWHQGRGR